MSLQLDSTSALLRKGLLAIAGLTTLGIAVELALERHWTQPVQLIAWATDMDGRTPPGSMVM